MNPEVKVQWVAALRSGEFQQGTGSLARDLSFFNSDSEGFEYCCLGVLCEVAAKAGVVSANVNPDTGYTRYGANKETAVLPYEVREWAALTDENPVVDVRDDDIIGMYSQTLVTLNDSERQPFSRIANLIEDQL